MSNNQTNNKTKKRVLSVYEKQQLLKYDLTQEALLNMGEMPVEYFTNWVDFAGIKLKINKNALIPRVETEELVSQAFSFAKKFKKNKIRVLEIGGGSGAITLALINLIMRANYLNKTWRFYLTEISARALSLAKENYQQLLARQINHEKLHVKFFLGNLLEKINDGQKFDLVIANLPYIPSREIEKLSSSVKDFEPIIALDGGETGFTLIAQTLEQLLEKKLLTKDSVLVFEVYHTHQLDFIRRYYPHLLNKFNIKFIKDQFARQRFLQLSLI